MVTEVIQQTADPLSSAFANASDIGAIGILGMLAVFVFRYLPKLAEKMMDEHRQTTIEFAAQLRLERELFERQIAAERQACKEQFEMLLANSAEHRDAVLIAIDRLERTRR